MLERHCHDNCAVFLNFHLVAPILQVDDIARAAGINPSAAAVSDDGIAIAPTPDRDQDQMPLDALYIQARRRVQGRHQGAAQANTERFGLPPRPNLVFNPHEGRGWSPTRLAHPAALLNRAALLTLQCRRECRLLISERVQRCGESLALSSAEAAGQEPTFSANRP